MPSSDLSSETAHQLPDFLTSQDINALNAGHHHAPFDVLGPHKSGNRRWIVTVQPDAEAVYANVGSKQTDLMRLGGCVFAAPVAGGPYTLTMSYAGGVTHTTSDPFSFQPVLTDFDLHLLGEGKHQQLWTALGAHVQTQNQVEGTHFAVWAPNAGRVSVVGDFNNWDGRRHP
ncbi:MAG: 1,4-alpha-glucan branching enzyme, partial [Pseudomonadota bacterium]